MSKSPAQLDAEVAEAERARRWQEQVAREDRERRDRINEPRSPEQIYEERQADVAAGVSHGEKRGRAKSFRKVATTAEALRASEAAKRWSDEAVDATEHNAATEAHRRAGRLHKSGSGSEAAWLHELAASNHRQAASALKSRAYKVSDPTRSQKTLAAWQEKRAAASEHTAMAQEYARQALAAAKLRG